MSNVEIISIVVEVALVVGFALLGRKYKLLSDGIAAAVGNAARSATEATKARTEVEAMRPKLDVAIDRLPKTRSKKAPQ